MNIRVRSFSEGDSISEITALLHAAYRSLADRGFRYVASRQDEATTLRRLRTGHAFIAESEGEIVGTVTLYEPSADSKCEWYRRPGVYRFGQFGVRPDLQQQGIGLRLYHHIESLACSLGVSDLALDTAEGASDLRRWYARLGFREIEFVSWEQTNYRSVVLSKTLTKSEVEERTSRPGI
jgi:predicted N-acetyltransferase YhbS